MLNNLQAMKYIFVLKKSAKVEAPTETNFVYSSVWSEISTSRICKNTCRTTESNHHPGCNVWDWLKDVFCCSVSSFDVSLLLRLEATEKSGPIAANSFIGTNPKRFHPKCFPTKRFPTKRFPTKRFTSKCFHSKRLHPSIQATFRTTLLTGLSSDKPHPRGSFINNTLLFSIQL